MRCYDNQRGFTLLEITIALIVIGLLTLPFVQQYRNTIYNQGYVLTQANQAIVVTAISNYYALNATYPCPDRSNLNYDSPGYGDGNTPLEDCTTNGEWTDPAIRVISGDIPVQDLGIEAKYSLDGWGNKMTYMVSKDLVKGRYLASSGPLAGSIIEKFVVTSNSSNRPSVDILSVDDTIASTKLPTENTGHVAIISYGPSAAGAKTPQNEIPVPCPSAGSTLDEENCDGDELLYSNQYNLNSSSQPGVDFYDDLVVVFSGKQSPPWANLRNNPENAYSYANVVGIGTDDPMGELAPGLGGILLEPLSGEKRQGMDVNGDILLQDVSATEPGKTGKIQAEDVCDETGNTDASGSGYCFNPEIVAGSGMNCGISETPIHGIANGGPVCFDYVPLAPGACGTGEYIVEIYADGSVRCDDMIP